MFRVEMFVDDKHVPTVLRAVVGIALRPPLIEPVANAQVDHAGGITAKTRGSLCDMFKQHVIDSGFSVMRPEHIHAWLRSIGKKPSSLPYAVKCGINEGWLRREGRGNKITYIVMHHAPVGRAKHLGLPERVRKARVGGKKKVRA